MSSVSISLPFVKSVEITATGSWTPPQGVNKILVVACGGGGGGQGGGKDSGSSIRAGGWGGSGAPVKAELLSVVPGTAYTITLGAGGAGGAGLNTNNTKGSPGSDGDPTTFGALATFPGGTGGFTKPSVLNAQGLVQGEVGCTGGGCGQDGADSAFAVGGDDGGFSGTRDGGGGGGASLGAGANGGAVDNPGSAGGANTGGGGGGGGGSSGAGIGGTGGNGGSGKVIIYYIGLRAI